MAPVLPLRTAWIADILSQVSLHDVERQPCWKCVSGDGQRPWDYCTARLSDLSMSLTSEVRRSPEPSARPSAATDNEERQIFTTCLFAESVGLYLLYRRKFSSAKNFVESDRQAVRQEFSFVKSWSSLVCSLLVQNISQEFNLVKKLL